MTIDGDVTLSGYERAETCGAVSADHGHGFPLRHGLQAVNMCGESGAF